MYFSLEEAIACPPPLTSSRSEKTSDANTQAKTTTEGSGSSGVERGALSGWCERPSIQAFINAVSSLSLRKKQQQLHEEKQKHEQLQYQKQQLQQQKLHLFQQQQQNPVDINPNSTNSPCGDQLQLTGFLKETAGASKPQNVGDVPENCQRRPKVRKVMKGGVLVSIPCTTRQSPGTDRCMENVNNSEKNALPFSNYKDKVNNFCAGNILDDILARANKQENLHNTVNKTPRKTSTSSESMVKNCRTNSTNSNPLISNEKMNETCEKTVYSTEVQSCVSEQYSPKAVEEKRSEPDYATKQIESTMFDGKNKVTADSIPKSNNVEASNVDLFKDKATDDSDKEDTTISKKLVVPFNGGITKEETAELETSSTIKSVEDKDAEASCIMECSQAEKREKEVTTQQIEMIGDVCEHCESDSSSGELVIDLGPVSNENKRSLRKSKQGRYTCTTSSESSNDLEIPSSFNRIRALQCDDDDVFTNETETCEINTVKGVPSTRLPDKDEKSSSFKEVQENFLDQGSLTKGDQRQSEKQPYKEDISEKHTVITDTRTSAEKTSEDCTNTQTKVLNDDVLPEDVSMVVQTQSLETLIMDDKTEVEFDVNDRKRKELTDEMSSSIETKRKRVKKVTTVGKAGQMKEELIPNTPSPIQTKRKGICKKTSRLQDENYQRSVTRSQTNSGKSPKDTQTQENIVATCSLRDAGDKEKQEHTPSLLSMVSNELWDITVVEKELVTRKPSAGRKKKKRNKPTEWFLRKKQQEQELRDKTKPSQYTYMPPVCIFFSKGTCAKGNLCQFRHEKSKELCSYYARNGDCYKFKDGMCPNLHNEFPCRFFHIKKFCWNEDDCRLSHETLTEETRGLLDNYLVTLEKRNKLLEEDAIKASESNISVTETSENRNNEKKMTLCSTDETGGCFSPVNQSPDTNTHTLPSETSSELTNSPKVKRLCSLSSYKPQVVLSLNNTVELSLEHSTCSSKMNPDEMSTSKTMSPFLPGIFKER